VVHTLIHPSAWHRRSLTFGFTLWILLPTPSAQPALISAILSLKDPEATLGAVAAPRPPLSASCGSCHHRHRCHQDTAVPP
jgi:hypothetical protein